MKVTVEILGDVSLTVSVFGKTIQVYGPAHLDKTESVDLSQHGYTTTFPLLSGFSGQINVDAANSAVVFSVLAGGFPLYSYPVKVSDLTGKKPIVVNLPTINTKSGWWKGLKLTNASIDISLV